MLREPCQDLAEPLIEKCAEIVELAIGFAVAERGVAVVEFVAIEQNLMSGVDFGGDYFVVAIVGVADPAVAAVPVFGYGFAVLEADLQVDGHYEIALAMDDYVISVAALADA